FEGVGMDLHVHIGSDVARGPDDLAGGEVECLDPAVDAELPARGPDDNLVVDVERAAVHRVAAGDTDGRTAHVGSVLPFERVALAREVERVQYVRPGRDDVHGAAHDERLALVAAEHTGGEGPDRVQ